MHNGEELKYLNFKTDCQIETAHFARTKGIALVAIIFKKLIFF
jgi:hypothetical protein